MHAHKLQPLLSLQNETWHLKKDAKVQGLIRYTGNVVFWILLIKTTNIKILLLLAHAELPGTSVNILPVENLGHEF